MVSNIDGGSVCEPTSIKGGTLRHKEIETSPVPLGHEVLDHRRLGYKSRVGGSETTSRDTKNESTLTARPFTLSLS